MKETLKQYINEAKRIVFFGGAGVSTESGLPDFRSVDGLYYQQFDAPPEEILSHDYFFSHTEKFFDFYRTKLLPVGIKPNDAHRVLAKWEQSGKLSAVVTQNIDGLHQDAGSKHVCELHGSVKRNHCLSCGAFYDDAFVRDAAGVPRCVCGGIVKPDVVLYGEQLDNETVDDAVNEISSADLLIVAGTSLTVYPAAGFLRYFGGDRLVLINRDPTPWDSAATLVLHEKVGVTLASCDG